MKSLPAIVDDLQALSAFLLDQAGQINELITFFGGSPMTALPAVTLTPVPLLPAVSLAPQPAGPLEKPPRKLRRHNPAHDESRKLSPEEKADIRKDWESLPKHLRTRENRAALALKHQCSRVQIFALVREDGHQAMITARSGRRYDQRSSGQLDHPQPNQPVQSGRR